MRVEIKPDEFGDFVTSEKDHPETQTFSPALPIKRLSPNGDEAFRSARAMAFLIAPAP